MLVIAIGLYLISIYLLTDSRFLNIIFRLVLLLIYPIILYFIGFFEKKELDVMKINALRYKTKVINYFFKKININIKVE